MLRSIFEKRGQNKGSVLWPLIVVGRNQEFFILPSAGGVESSAFEPFEA